MLGFIAWVFVGLIAGLLARALVPGRQAMGFLATICLGLVGSLFGGWISSMIWPHADGFHAAGILMSTLGAILVLFVFVAFSRRRLERH